jgi:hypothetical protein
MRQKLDREETGDGLVVGLLKWLGTAATTASSTASPLQVRRRLLCWCHRSCPP